MRKRVIFVATLLLLLAQATGCGSVSNVNSPEVNETPSPDISQIYDTVENAANPQNSDEGRLPETDAAPDMNDANTPADANLMEIDLPISPYDLINTGGNLLADMKFGYRIQFPAEWFFRGSAALMADYEEYVEMNPDGNHSFLPSTMRPPAFLIKAEEVLASQATSDLGNHVRVYYWNYDAQFEEAARLLWEYFSGMVERHNRLQGLRYEETSYINELERIDADGVEAYRFLVQFDTVTFKTDIDGSRYDEEKITQIRHEYLIPLSERIYANFSLVMSEEDSEYLDKFNAAMESFAWIISPTWG